MRAAVCERWGSVEGMVLRELPDPVPGPGEVRLRVEATSLNGADAEMLAGWPLYGRMGRPRHGILGSDIAGTVEAVGEGVEEVGVGDAVIAEVFERFGGLAERVCVPADRLVPKPPGLSFALASAVPQAGALALQGLGSVVGEGSRVLLVGAGGGVGVFALLLAKRRGAVVTAVDHGGKLAAMQALGADRVVDHTVGDGLEPGVSYDLILDAVGRGSVRAFHRALAPGGAYLAVGGPILRLLWTVLYGTLVGLVGGPKLGLLMWDRGLEHVEEVAELALEGGLEAVVGEIHPLEEAPAALRQLLDRAVVGKVVVRVAP